MRSNSQGNDSNGYIELSGSDQSVDQIYLEAIKMNEAFQKVMNFKDVYLYSCLSDTQHIENQGTLVISAGDTIKFLDTEKNRIVTLQNKSVTNTRMFGPQFEKSQNYLQMEDIKDSSQEVEVSVMKESPDGRTLMIG